MYTVHRYHDICAGHRVVGHENKCANLHGHNYRIHFHIAQLYEKLSLDSVGRVVDFSFVKETLCQWLEDNWDHKFLMWENDPYLRLRDVQKFLKGIVVVPFNPTAENMAKYLVEEIAPKLLANKPIKLQKVEIEETRKCSASYEVK